MCGFAIASFHDMFYFCRVKDELASRIFPLVLYVISNNMELRNVIDEYTDTPVSIISVAIVDSSYSLNWGF